MKSLSDPKICAFSLFDVLQPFLNLSKFSGTPGGKLMSNEVFLNWAAFSHSHPLVLPCFSTVNFLTFSLSFYFQVNYPKTQTTHPTCLMTNIFPVPHRKRSKMASRAGPGAKSTGANRGRWAWPGLPVSCCPPPHPHPKEPVVLCLALGGGGGGSSKEKSVWIVHHLYSRRIRVIEHLHMSMVT